MRAIISTGQGRLHLIESAKAIKMAGIEVKIVTGWVPPSFLPDRFLNVIGSFVGRKNLAYGLRKRKPAEFEFNEIKKCTSAEFFIQFLFIISKLKLLKRDRAATIGWKFFGWQSKKFINNAQIFHVRSGAGHGGAIMKAKNSGMIIIVDHSIAHPAEVYNQMIKANNGSKDGISINPESKFWKLVLNDCKNADVIQVNSEYVKTSFVENGFDPGNIKVIQLGVRSDFHKLKIEYAINGPIRILFTGGFGQRKGSLLIIESIKKLLEQGINFQLDIVGSIISDFALPTWFTNQPQVKLHGYIPQNELKSYFKNADIYIFPSYSEGAAQSLKEAMTAGLPVISTKQSGGPIIHGKNGWLIPDDSAIDLTEAIQILAKDRKLRERLGKNGSNTISKEHTWEKYGEEVAKLYQKLCQK